MTQVIINMSRVEILSAQHATDGQPFSQQFYSHFFFARKKTKNLKPKGRGGEKQSTKRIVFLKQAAFLWSFDIGSAVGMS